jgi:hypothetical protein
VISSIFDDGKASDDDEGSCDSSLVGGSLGDCLSADYFCKTLVEEYCRLEALALSAL